MTSYLSITIRFLQPYYHGRGDGGESKWPPSPLRVYQAIVAAASRRWGGAQFQKHAAPALQWLEQRPLHAVVASNARRASSKYRLYVPDNVADMVAKSWSAGRPASIADYRTEKDVRPMHLSAEAIHYLYDLTPGGCPCAETLTAAARSITHLGWGVDMVAGNASVISAADAAALPGERWHPVTGSSATSLRTPIEGTLDDLIAKHQAFLGRIGRDAKGEEFFSPVPPLAAFRVLPYRRATDPAARPAIAFELRQEDGLFFRYSHDRLIHIAGMVRHLAIATMQRTPPSGVDAKSWVESYVAGHAPADATDHRRFSYLPLPSIGHLHADPSVRRVMIAAPPGDGRFLRHLAARLSGQQLKPTPETKMAHPPILVQVSGDNVTRRYTQPSNAWASVTPVILPGHDDHKPEKTRRLIEKSLAQSGVELPCEFEWSAFSHFPKSLSAHKYGRDKRPAGYIRPDHLLSQTAVHLKLRFQEGVSVPGPLVIGAGRHCGFGLMAAIDG